MLALLTLLLLILLLITLLALLALLLLILLLIALLALGVVIIVDGVVARGEADAVAAGAAATRIVTVLFWATRVPAAEL